MSTNQYSYKEDDINLSLSQKHVLRITLIKKS